MASYDDTATVSGSVVGFSNGADSVPLKNWLVTLPASLDGYSEVNGVQAKKNLFDGWTKGYGLNTSTGAIQPNSTGAISGYLPVKGDSNYYLSGLTNTLRSFIAYYKTDKTFISRTNGNDKTFLSFTPPSESAFIIVYQYEVSSSTGTIDDVDNLQTQLEVGSTATAYEAYEAPTTYTASLGRTIYGGTVDVATGSGKDTSKTVKLSAFTWEYVTGEYSYGYFVRSGNVADMATNKNFQATGYINNGNPRSSIEDGEIGVYNNANAVRRPVIRDDSCTSLEQFLAKIADYDFVYECTNTPTSFTFDPVTIETSKGSNTFWSEQGDSEVTYYKDGYGFTSVTVHKETPDGEPVEQTAKLHKIVYGGLVDVISGKAEPKNLAEFSNADNANKSAFEYTTEKPELIEWTKTGSGSKFYARFILHIPKPGKYTISCTNNSTLKVKYIYSNELWGTAVYSNISTNPFVAEFSASGDYVMGFYAGSTATSGTLGEVMCEEGETQTSYAPYFAPFSFPPISMETDEGENTLYADQGDSAITYRKAVE